MTPAVVQYGDTGRGMGPLYGIGTTLADAAAAACIAAGRCA